MDRLAAPRGVGRNQFRARAITKPVTSAASRFPKPNQAVTIASAIRVFVN
jgi:hypothetical protein